LNPEQSISEIILPHFPEIDENQISQFVSLYHLYSEWNTKINLISRKDIDFLYERHILHSLSIAKIIRFLPDTTILDAGTGGGFPGIPLSILFPEVSFVLADSMAKKIKVVDEIIIGAKIENARTLVARVEDIDDKFDFIVSRAVTAFPQFYDWVKNKIHKKSFNALPNGIIALKGGELTEELSVFEGLVKIYELKSFFEQEFFETKKIVYLPRWEHS
jgi:16S rRNA (guanine527-N7)-methyltransferase